MIDKIQTLTLTLIEIWQVEIRQNEIG